jgi:hypothetical protein
MMEPGSPEVRRMNALDPPDPPDAPDAAKFSP